MYLITYRHKETEYPGFMRDDGAYVPAAGIMPVTVHDMTSLIEAMNGFNIDAVKDAVNQATIVHSSSEVQLLAPIPYPRRNIICLGKNYVDHVKEVSGLSSVGNDLPEAPIYFSKLAYPAANPGDTIDAHADFTSQLDYEAELAVIIGKKCSHIKKEYAEEYIFGYTIANDLSARDLQTDRKQWHLGKSLDGYCPMGPRIVHKSLLPLPVNLKIQSFVNDELRQNSSTSKLIFSIPEIIEDLTKGVTLYPGDIIMTGTPAGVGTGFRPPKYLKSGDKVECRIEKIGSLINTIA